MLDTAFDYRHITMTRNTVSHSTPCEECFRGYAHNHLSPEGYPHIASSTRLGHLHECRIHLDGSVSCTCEHGQIQRARRQSAHCLGHIAQAELLMRRAGMFEGAEHALITLPDSEYELWGGDEEAAIVPEPAPAVFVQPRIESVRDGLIVEEQTTWRYFVQAHIEAKTVQTVRRDNFGWKCECTRDRMTPENYCRHIRAVRKHRGEY